MSMSKEKACALLRELSKQVRQELVAQGKDDGGYYWLDTIAALIENDWGVRDAKLEEVLDSVCLFALRESLRRVRDAKLEEVLDRLRGDRHRFRSILTDRTELLAKVCDYADRLADRRRTEPWVICKEIFGHGSGVSSAIFQTYRRERQ